MKIILSAIFFLFTFGFGNKELPQINDEIITAFETGNSKTLSSYFSSNIDLNIPGNEGVFSKAQAQLILKDFFKKNSPDSFKILHSGTSKNEAYYSIGNLSTSGGKFRTYLLYKKKDDEIIIQELRIESDE